MSNPYESPQGNFAPQFQTGGFGGGPRLGDSAYVRQIMVICILLFVQAGLELLMGVLLLLGGSMMGSIFNSIPQQPNRPGPPAGLVSAVTTGYIIAGLILAAIAILRIMAGILNLKYRSRGLGIVAMSVGLLPVLTIYCAPTAIGLMVYGLIIYLNPDSKQAFDLGNRGHTRDQVHAAPRYG